MKILIVKQIGMKKYRKSEELIQIERAILIAKENLRKINRELMKLSIEELRLKKQKEDERMVELRQIFGRK